MNQRGYTCHAPLFKGHGMGPDKLIETGPDDWWQDVKAGYRFLESEGFKEIAVAGVSLGGVFSLKIGETFPVKGVVSMSGPAKEKGLDDLYKRVRDYAREYKKLEGKDEEQITEELKEFEHKPMPTLKNLRQTIVDTSNNLGSLTSPLFILYGGLDETLYKESAQIIYDHVNTENKQMKGYDQTGHIMTLGGERDKIYEDIYDFLNSLNW